MKKLICLLLSLTLLFCGCTADPQPTETTPSSTAATQGTTQAVDYMQNVLDLAQIPEDPEPQPLLLDYDPDRKIYIELANSNSDFFPHREGGNTTSFQIYSRSPLSVADVQFQIPCQTEYEVLVRDASRSFAPDAGNLSKGEYNNLPCLLQLGTDFGELMRYSMICGAAGKLRRENMVGTDKEATEAYRKIEEEYFEKYTNLLLQLNSQPADAFPNKPVYAYAVDILFSPNYKMYDETVETIDVTIQGKKYTVDVGQWRFHSKLPDDLTEAMETFLENKDPGTSHSKHVTRTNPYNGGYAYSSNVFDFTAEQDMTLLGVEQVFGGDMPIEVLGARVTIKGVEFFWDFERPLDVTKGTNITMDLYFHDEMFEKTYARAHTTYRLNCQIRQNIVPKLAFINMSARPLFPYATYLVAFEGVDLSNYFYWNFEDETLDAMPEEWRN